MAFNQEALLPQNHKVEEAKQALSNFCKEVHVLSLPCETQWFGRNRLLAMNVFSPYPYDVNWTKSGMYGQTLANILKSKGIDLVHFDTIGLAQYRAYIDGIPAILNHHNVESHMRFRRVHFERNILKRAYLVLDAMKLKRYERTTCHRFDLNTVVSNLDAKRLNRINPHANITVISNGVDCEYFQPRQLHDLTETNILFVGGLRWYPNRDAVQWFLREVWPSLHSEMPDLKFYIVGHCSQKEADSITSENPNVIVTGFVEDVRIYFQRASIFICPMRTGGGTRLKMLDALASGKPIVATSMACEGIEVVDGASVIIADTPSDFCSKIVKLLKQPERRMALGNEARKLAERKYSWTVIGDDLRKAYREVLSYRTRM